MHKTDDHLKYVWRMLIIACIVCMHDCMCINEVVHSDNISTTINSPELTGFGLNPPELIRLDGKVVAVLLDSSFNWLEYSSLIKNNTLLTKLPIVSSDWAAAMSSRPNISGCDDVDKMMVWILMMRIVMIMIISIMVMMIMQPSKDNAYMASYHIISYIISYLQPLQHVISYIISSHHITHHITSYITSYHIIPTALTTRHITSCITSYHTIPTALTTLIMCSPDVKL